MLAAITYKLHSPPLEEHCLPILTMHGSTQLFRHRAGHHSQELRILQ